MRARRQRIIKIRLSEDEWARVHQTFPRGTLATTVRKLALGASPPKSGAAKATRQELLLALGQLGHDLNHAKHHEPAKRRGHTLRIRFSDDEWQDIQATFPKGGVGTAIRGLALGEPAPHRSPVLEARHDLLLAIARLGNNLNQLARGVNRANLAGGKIDPIRVLAKLVEIQDSLNQL
jgi:hypothetical protein